VRAPGEKWTEFDPDAIVMRYCKWRPGLTSCQEEVLELHKLKLKQNMKLLEVLQLISESSGIPFERLVVSKRYTVSGVQHAQLLSQPETYQDSLHHHRLSETSIFYVEEKSDEEMNLPMLDYKIKWSAEFEADSYRISIRFNNLEAEGQGGFLSSEYPHEVQTDNRETVATLKALICAKLDVDQNQIIMKRAGKHGIEIKDLRQTLRSTGFVDKSTVYVAYGQPTTVGQCKCSFSLAKVKDPLTDCFLYDFQPLFDLPIDEQLTGTQLTELIVKEMAKHGFVVGENEYIRLRERSGERLSRVYRDIPLKTQGIYDGKQIAIEIKPKPEVMPGSFKEHLVVFRVWDPQTYNLSGLYELIVDRTAENSTMLEGLLKILPEFESIDNIELFKFTNFSDFTRYDLISREVALPSTCRLI
jgi:hypothetical protein